MQRVHLQREEVQHEARDGGGRSIPRDEDIPLLLPVHLANPVDACSISLCIFSCPNCLAEITFKTDIENVDYKMEHGATRLFDAFKFYQEKEKERANEEEEEKADAMKMLEKRTKMSKMEMEALGELTN